MKEEQIRFQLRLPTELHEWVVKGAEANDRSMNNQIIWLLRKAKEAAK